MTNSETVNDLPIQNLNIQEDKKEEESPEIIDTLIIITTRSVSGNTSDG